MNSDTERLDWLISKDGEMTLRTNPQTGMAALTTLLHKVCNGNDDKFEEACRLLDLFMDKAVELKK